MEASTVLVRENSGHAESVQIFGSLASSRSRLHAAMRNPRQSRCTAAITTKHVEALGGRAESSTAVFAASLMSALRRGDGTGFEQTLPDA